jgi:hypothetical protein
MCANERDVPAPCEHHEAKPAEVRIVCVSGSSWVSARSSICIDLYVPILFGSNSNVRPFSISKVDRLARPTAAGTKLTLQEVLRSGWTTKYASIAARGGRIPNKKEWAKLARCRCPACELNGSRGLKADGLGGFCNRATHNLSVGQGTRMLCFNRADNWSVVFDMRVE